jgi:hypothetical protein
MKYQSSIFFLGFALWSLVFISTGHAQFWGDSYSAVTYNMGLPVGDTKDFTSPYSWRGIGLEFRKMNSANTSIGLSLGWNVFHEETNETIEFVEVSGHVTGNQDRSINAFPLMVGFQYYLGQDGGARPYLGLSGPGFYMIERLDIGVVSLQDDGWNWGVAPEIGFLVPLQSGATLLLNARYNYAFEGYGRGPYSYIGFNVGFAWSSY